jgi:putative transcriptional regulator
MTQTSLTDYLAARAEDPAIQLMAGTIAAMRADPAYVAREDDLAAAAFLDVEGPAALADDALDRVLARIEVADSLDDRAQARASKSADPRLAEIARLPSPVREAAFKALEHDRWRFGAFGLRRLPLDFGETHCELMRIEPGYGASDHDHVGDELTLILTGAYNDGHHDYAPGDVSLARDGFVHCPKAMPGDVCYVLAVTYGVTKFKGPLGIVQRIIGFPWTPRPRRQR